MRDESKLKAASSSRGPPGEGTGRGWSPTHPGDKLASADILQQPGEGRRGAGHGLGQAAGGARRRRKLPGVHHGRKAVAFGRAQAQTTDAAGEDHARAHGATESLRVEREAVPRIGEARQRHQAAGHHVPREAVAHRLPGDTLPDHLEGNKD